MHIYNIYVFVPQQITQTAWKPLQEEKDKEGVLAQVAQGWKPSSPTHQFVLLAPLLGKDCLLCLLLLLSLLMLVLDETPTWE